MGPGQIITLSHCGWRVNPSSRGKLAPSPVFAALLTELETVAMPLEKVVVSRCVRMTWLNGNSGVHLEPVAPPLKSGPRSAVFLVVTRTRGSKQF